ncbi:MAG: DNA-directed RNA polymerase subunit D [Candidatus Pacearchaeota archaeon]
MAIKVEILESNEEKIRFIVRGINYTIANAIRRSSFEIPMPAIDELEITENSSVLYDEILANRLCLIPFVPNREINEREKCSCKGKGCSKCTLKVKLEVEGKKEGCMIYASSIKGEAKPLFPEMPVVWLESGQEIKLVASIKLGKALEHAKYQAGLFTYYPLALLKSFDAKAKAFENPEVKEMLKKFKISLEKGEELDEKQYEILDYIKDKWPETKIELELSESDFVFDIESFSYLKPKDIFIKAIEALDANLAELAKIK